MRFAAIQYRPVREDPTQSRERLARYVRKAAAQGAQLIVCPELACTGYLWVSVDEIRPWAEPVEGETYRMLSVEARAARAWIACGFIERAEDDRLYNACMIVDDRGTLVACYRKATLFDADRTWATEGEGPLWVESPFGRLAAGICMDLNNDGWVRWLRTERVEVLAFCTSWLDQQHGVLGYWAQRLRPWSGVVVAANRWGVERGVPFRGESAIFRAQHQVCARAGRRGDEVIVADLDSRT